MLILPDPSIELPVIVKFCAPLPVVYVPSTTKLLPLTVTPLVLLIVRFSTLYPAGVIV